MGHVRAFSISSRELFESTMSRLLLELEVDVIRRVIRDEVVGAERRKGQRVGVLKG